MTYPYHKYNSIVDNLKKYILLAKEQSINMYFIFVDIDFNNAQHISLLHPDNNLPDIKAHIIKSLRNSINSLNLTVEEIIVTEAEIAFVLQNDINELDLHKAIAFMYNQINKNIPFFINCSFTTLKFPEVSDNCLEIVSQIVINGYLGNQNFLYHKQINDFKNDSSFFSENMNKMRHLVDSYQKNNLVLVFQPVICCKSGKIFFYECLLRVIKPCGSLESAAELIHIAEKYKYISFIDEVVFDLVIDKLIKFPDICFSINLSSACVDNYSLINKIIKSLKSRPDLSSRLIIELTETLLYDKISSMKDFVTQMHEIGVRIALDDFGNGYTSFKQLKTLSIDIIKIDGAFIKDVIENIDNKMFIGILIKIAQETAAVTVAEFVENGYTAKYLMDAGVDYMQGYYFSKAILEEEIIIKG